MRRTAACRTAPLTTRKGKPACGEEQRRKNLDERIAKAESPAAAAGAAAENEPAENRNVVIPPDRRSAGAMGAGRDDRLAGWDPVDADVQEAADAGAKYEDHRGKEPRKSGGERERSRAWGGPIAGRRWKSTHAAMADQVEPWPETRRSASVSERKGPLLAHARGHTFYETAGGRRTARHPALSAEGLANEERFCGKTQASGFAVGKQTSHCNPDRADRRECNTVFDSQGTKGLFVSSQFKGSTPVKRAHGALSKE